MSVRFDVAWAANIKYSRRAKMTDQKPENVKCPDCDGEMIPRLSQHGKFWGCKSYPKCKGTRDSMGLSKADRLKERNEDHEDVGPDPFAGTPTKTTWNKK